MPSGGASGRGRRNPVIFASASDPNGEDPVDHGLQGLYLNGESPCWLARTTDSWLVGTNRAIHCFRQEAEGKPRFILWWMNYSELTEVTAGHEWFDEFVRFRSLRDRNRVNFGNAKSTADAVVSLVRKAMAEHGLMATIDEVDSLQGAGEFQEYVRQLRAIEDTSRRRRAMGHVVNPMTRHVVMTGNPGTGKTTAARLLGRIYRDMGVLRLGTLKEVSRSDLVGEYVGWTAQRTKQAIEDARGGVLFIDEAYSLSVGGSQDFGSEAVNELVQAMENHRDDLVVVVAGYPEEMTEFLNMNPGLRSRFAATLRFPNLDPQQLTSIVIEHAGREGLHLTPAAQTAILSHFETIAVDRSFGNGRDARNLFEATKLAQAMRLSQEPQAELMEITAADILAATR